MKPIVAVLLLAFLSGCESGHVYRYEPKPALDAAGHTFEQGRRASLALFIGMPADDVRGILGNPDETSASTYGGDFGRPWPGVCWVYKWNQDWPQTPRKMLSIVFDATSRPLRVNNWEWSDF
jgi:hypothetical protein